MKPSAEVLLDYFLSLVLLDYFLSFSFAVSRLRSELSLAL